MPKIAPIRRAYNDVADNTAWSIFIRLFIYLFIYCIIVHEVQNTHIQRKIGLKKHKIKS